MKKQLMVYVVLASALLLIGACQKKSVQPDGSTTQSQQQSTASGDQKASTASQQPQSGTKPEGVTSQDLSSYTEKKDVTFGDIYFDYDKYNVADSYKPTLQAVVSYLQKNSAMRLAIEGHCDERGTNEYNMALGDRRAKAVSEALVALGVQSAKIETVSYGEEKPVCTAQSEDCWQKNRRAHFVILQKAGK